MSMIGNFRLASPGEIELLHEEPDSIHEFLGSEAADDSVLDVDKAWHGLHYLLTGVAWDSPLPLGFIAAGGLEIGDEDVGYGPARSFTADEVRALCRALEPLTSDVLRQRFDPKAMDAADIYPSGWARVSEEDSRDYLLSHFDTLKQFLAGGAKRGLGLVTWLD
ncbi:MAG: YfbM family protein [Myxococcales bacterium]